jgi:hypothetical protein
VEMVIEFWVLKRAGKKTIETCFGDEENKGKLKICNWTSCNWAQS